MTKLTTEYRLEKLHLPVAGYSYIVRIFRSVDNGKNFRTIAEAAAFKAEEETREGREES